MKINSIAISNIRSFKYDPEFSEIATFNRDGLNLVIGPNGAGKSNLIEIMTRIFVSIYGSDVVPYNELRPLVSTNKTPIQYSSEPGLPSTFTKNRGSLKRPSSIRIELQLDDGDLSNLKIIKKHSVLLNKIQNTYFNDQVQTGYSSLIYSLLDEIPAEPTTYTIELADTLGDNNQRKMAEKAHNLATAYLRAYRHISIAIDIHNDLLRPELFKEFEINEPHAVSYQNTLNELGIPHNSKPIKRLEPTLLLMSVQDRIAQIDLTFAKLVDSSQSGVSSRIRVFERQLMQKSAVGGMSTNASECFEILKERIWYDCFERISGSSDVDQVVKYINQNSKTLLVLNRYLKWFDLKISLDSFNPARSLLQFKLTESKHQVDIVDLSSGQRTIINIACSLTMGAELKSLVLIDEIENHLHPSIQSRLRDALVELSTLGSQTIAVTHSPIFITSKTLENTARVYSDSEGSKIRLCKGALDGDAKAVVNVLQYSNGARVFFTNKVLLVEGPSDEEFFSAYLEHYYPGIDIEVISTGSKTQIQNWKEIISQFDVSVHAISDLDSATKKAQPTIKPVVNRSRIKSDFSDKVYEILMSGTASMRKNNRYILTQGALESYVPGTGDKIKSVRDFINQDDWSKLKNADEIKEIVSSVVSSS